MEDFGFIRVAAATPKVKVADVDFNAGEICSLVDKAGDDGVSIIVFPELCVTGYTCADLFGQTALIQGAERGVEGIIGFTRGKSVTVVVGTPVSHRGRLYNCAAVIRDGTLYGLVPKVHIPTYNEFYEGRWFASGEDLDEEIDFCGRRVRLSPWQLFRQGNARFAVEICEDLWAPVPPSSYHAVAGAQILLNLSASNEIITKHEYRKGLVCGQSGRTISAYVYSACGWGESTQDLVFAGPSMIAENGSLMAEARRFQTQGSMIEADIDTQKLETLRRRQSSFEAFVPYDYSETDLGEGVKTDFESRLIRHIDPHPFVPEGPERDARAREITSIQVTGLMTRLDHIRCQRAVIGISGGLDSTLALLVACTAFDRLGLDRSGIIGVTMPGFGTTGRTYRNALELMRTLGVSVREISIVKAVSQHFSDIGQDPDVHDVTYENSQARERTQILMDIANKENGIVVGTGDLSELALGWATYNGDHMSMYGVNAGVPKTLVRHLVRWMADNYFDSSADGERSPREILLDICDTPISPELTPADENGEIAQKTEDIVGPYELHDFYLYNFLRFGFTPSKLLLLARKAFLGGENTFVGPEGVATQYTPEILEKWLKVFCKRFFSQQFKRSCMPDCPKVGSVSLSPRGDWRMPSDASANLWTYNF